MIADSLLQNIILTKAAVGRESSNVFLFMPTTQNLHSPSILYSDPDFVPVQVPMIALDHFTPLENISKIKLVKIDVEGYEPDVLLGMNYLIKNKRVENIICEFNSGWLKRNSVTPTQFLERFLDLGYQICRQTRFEENLIGRHSEFYTLQDIWFSIKSY